MTTTIDAARPGSVGGGADLAASALDGAPTPATPKTFVLVHGAWHGGWCWRRVADRLRADGHRVLTPTNTGLGDRSHLLTKDIDVTTHVRDIVNLVRWEDLSDVVLVGHSYGGLVISGVADEIPDRLSSIVFLDAVLPEDGVDLASTASPAFRAIIEAAAQSDNPGLKAPPAKAFGVTDAEDGAWVEAKCTAQPVATFTQKVRVKGGRDTVAKRTYIRAKGNASPAFDAALAKVTALGGWTTYEFACGHDVMILEPDLLTRTILAVA